jgi:hypothetical protein
VLVTTTAPWPPNDQQSLAAKSSSAFDVSNTSLVNAASPAGN